MEGIIAWVKNITYYLIVVRMLLNLIPGGTYERFIRLFSGAVFILIVAGPLLGGLKLDEKIAYAYEKIRFEQDTSEFEDRMWGVEEERKEQILLRYEEAIARDIQAMAENEGLSCREAEVAIEGRNEEEAFGRVTGIRLVFGRKEERGGDKASGQQAAEIRIQVETDHAEKEAGARAHSAQNQKEQEALYEFQRKLAGYYQLEEADIRITWEDD